MRAVIILYALLLFGCQKENIIEDFVTIYVDIPNATLYVNSDIRDHSEFAICNGKKEALRLDKITRIGTQFSEINLSVGKEYNSFDKSEPLENKESYLNARECKAYKIDMKAELLSFNISKERLQASATFEGRLIYSDYKNVYRSNVFQFRIK